MQTVLRKPLREYRTAKGWRIFIYIFITPLTVLFLWMALIMPYQLETNNVQIALFCTPLGLGMAALFIYGLLDTIKGRLQVFDDRLVLINPYQIKELLFSNIKGFRTNEHYAFIYAKEGRPEKLQISAYTGMYNELLMWLHQNYIDLDNTEAAQHEQQILENTEYGRNTDEREQKLSESRKVTKALNGGGLALGLWLMFVPAFYEISIAMGLLFPLIVIACIYFYKGLISINEKKNNAYPTITSALVLPPLGLFLRAILDLSILEYSNLIPAFIGLWLIPFFVIIAGVEKSSFIKKTEYFTLLAHALFFAAYGWGAAAMVNCLYDDKSIPAFYEAEIISKHISSGKTTTYYLELSSWGPRVEAEDVSVERDLYETLNPGDSVDVYLKPGLLKAPWFVVTQKE